MACVGIPLGCISAYNRGKWLDNVIIVFATCGIAIPSFISSVLLLYQFGMNMKVLLILAAGGGAAVYFLVLKPKQGKKVPSDLDDFDLEDEEEYLTEDEEMEEKNE